MKSNKYLFFQEPCEWYFRTREQERVAKQLMRNVRNFLNKIEDESPTESYLYDYLYDFIKSWQNGVSGK